MMWQLYALFLDKNDNIIPLEADAYSTSASREVLFMRIDGNQKEKDTLQIGRD